MLSSTGLFRQFHGLESVWPGILAKARECYANNIAATTSQTYVSQWNHWVAFRRKAGWCATDVITEERLCMWAVYAAYFAKRPLEGKSVRDYLVGIRHIMIELDLGEPAKWRRLYRVMKGLQRLKGSRPKNRKLPVTLDHAQRILEKIGPNQQCRGDELVCFTILVMAIVGLHRMGELTSANTSTPTGPTVAEWNQQQSTLFLPRSKEDIFGVGVHVAYPGMADVRDKELCVQYLVKAHLDERRKQDRVLSSHQLFLRQDGKPVTRAWWVRWLRDKLKDVVPNVQQYAGHSCRSWWRSYVGARRCSPVCGADIGSVGIRLLPALS